jgi:hypothetical protein
MVFQDEQRKEAHYSVMQIHHVDETVYVFDVGGIRRFKL